MSIGSIIEVGKTGLRLKKGLQRMWDARVLTVIENENRICPLEFICKQLPKRSNNSLSKSLRRLTSSGDVYRAGNGYVSRTMQERLCTLAPGW